MKLTVILLIVVLVLIAVYLIWTSDQVGKGLGE